MGMFGQRPAFSAARSMGIGRQFSADPMSFTEQNGMGQLQAMPMPKPDAMPQAMPRQGNQIASTIAGSIGDYLLQQAGARPVYAPMQQQRQQAELQQQQLEMQQSRPEFREVNGSIVSIDPRTGQSQVVHQGQPEQTGFARELAAAGIDPNSDQGRALMLNRLQNQANPYIPMRNDDGTIQLVRPPLSGAPTSQATPPPPPEGFTIIGDGGAPQGNRPFDQRPQPAARAAASRPTGNRALPRSIRNNNPGNIEDGPYARRQPGYVGGDGRFARFNSPQAGAAAHSALLGGYINRGHRSVAAIVGRWAPASENGSGTSSYIAHVARRLGVNPNAPLAPNRIPELQAAMAEVESGIRRR